MAVEVKLKRWGNSMAVIIPKNVVKMLRVKPNETLEVQVSRKTNVLKEFFGCLKSSKPTVEILKEARKGTSKWD